MHRDSRMERNDWEINAESAAVLSPYANLVTLVEGTQYVTKSLVLPMVHKAIRDTEKSTVNVRGNARNASVLMPEVVNARRKLADDMNER